MSGLSTGAAATTYEYTGNPLFCGSCTTGLIQSPLTGFVTFATPLQPNLGMGINPSPESPLSFTFSDGLTTITNLTALHSSFSFATDALGDITEWQFALQGNDASNIPPIVSFISTSLVSTICSPAGVDASVCDFVENGNGTLTNPDFQNLNMPGQWTILPPAETPVPPTFPLLVAGLGVLGAFGWATKRKNAAALAAS